MSTVLWGVVALEDQGKAFVVGAQECGRTECFIDGAVECGVCVDELRGHRCGVVEVCERRFGVGLPRLEYLVDAVGELLLCPLVEFGPRDREVRKAGRERNIGFKGLFGIKGVARV